MVASEMLWADAHSSRNIARYPFSFGRKSADEQGREFFGASDERVYIIY
jgi:hypothetical protein